MERDCAITYQKKTLCALYYSLMYSRVKYGNITKGNAAKTYLNRVTVRMNDILRATNFGLAYQNVNNLYKNFKLLKLHDIHRLELTKFMYKSEHNVLPKLFNNNFVKITNHHKYWY